MDQAEASGKTVDDALSRALKIIGASRDDIDAERVELIVLDEGRKGMFGVGSREARVRVQRVGGATAQEAPSPAEARTPKEGGRGQRGAQRGAGNGEARGQRQPAEGRQGGGGRSAAPRNGNGAGNGEGRGGRAPRGGRDRRPSGRAGYDQAAPKLTEADFLKAPTFEDAPAEAEKPQRARTGEGRAERSERPRDRDRGPRPAAQAAPRERRHREDEPKVDPDINAVEVDFAAHIVDDLLHLLDINAELTLREPLSAGDGLGAVRAVIDINGDDLGLLIGRRGDTLLSLQYLVNLIVTRQYPDGPGVSIDVEHYRHRRESQVMALAQRMADRVRQTGNPITLEPMPPSERRLIHLALADDPELETNSIGDGENRKVVISTRR